MSLALFSGQRTTLQCSIASKVSATRVIPQRAGIAFLKSVKKVSGGSRLGLDMEAGKATNGVGDKDGVIIVDHGSRRQESNAMLNEFVEIFKEKTGYPIVEPAHMELAEPCIKDAFGSCVQQGANRVIISPFFLFPGRHWQQDIPLLAHDAASAYPGVSYIVTAPLGLHELLVDVVNDRIKYCLRHAAGDEGECSVCAGTGRCKLTSAEEHLKP